MPQVKKRQIFYVSAFDPRGASSFWRLYKAEAQCKSISVTRRKKESKLYSHWQIKSQNNQTITDFHYLHWDDIIRKNWIKSPFKLIMLGLKCNWHYYISDTFYKVRKLRLSPALSGATPLFISVLILLLSFFVLSVTFYSLPFSTVLNFTISIAFAVLVIFFLVNIANKFNLFWILRGHVFFSNLSKFGNKELRQRIDELAEHISGCDLDDYDEVLIIGHCMGVNIAVSALATIIKNDPDFDTSRVRFLSLAQVIPWLSFLPEAVKFRKDLKTLAEHGVKWVDISSPADYICFALSDPYIGIECNIRQPVSLVNPKFHLSFNKGDYKKIKRNRLKMHFQYLMSTNKTKGFDFYQVTGLGNRLEEYIETLRK